jgi:hypothetical protein
MLILSPDLASNNKLVPEHHAVKMYEQWRG